MFVHSPFTFLLFYFFTFLLFTFLPLKRSLSHATGSSQCRQECRERSYYNLHRQLNKSLFLHFSLINSALRVFISPPELGGVRGGLIRLGDSPP